jgi:hypothetical protein
MDCEEATLPESQTRVLSIAEAGFDEYLPGGLHGIGLGVIDDPRKCGEKILDSQGSGLSSHSKPVGLSGALAQPAAAMNMALK